MWMDGAAIFDLDRTLLRTSSTPAINEALFEVGLARRPSVPGQGLMMRFYNLFGETVPAMALARGAVLAARGWPVDAVRDAAELVADLLELQVLPYVPALLARHRAEGRRLVLATTTPDHYLMPFARRLGIDLVIATRYATEKDSRGVERFTGNLEGPFIWSRGKLQAVRRWAAVEADQPRRQLGLLRQHLRPAPAARRRSPDGGEPGRPAPRRRHPAALAYRSPGQPGRGAEGAGGGTAGRRASPLPAGRRAVQLALTSPGRRTSPGADLPSSPPTIAATSTPRPTPSRCSKRAATRRGLAKKELFDAPVVGSLARASGAICVDRKLTGRAAFEAAEQALRDGEVLVVTPQGTIPRGEDFFDPHLRGKTGAARLAAATGAPVIPLGVWGSERVWPRSTRLPNVTNVLHPPTVRVRVGPPVEGLTGYDFKTDTEVIMEAITDLLPPEARLRRIPTAEELARTMPPGEGSL